MRLSIPSDLLPDVGERVGLRIGDLVHGCVVEVVHGGVVTVELPDADLMLNTGVRIDQLPTQARRSRPLPMGSDTSIWVADQT